MRQPHKMVKHTQIIIVGNILQNHILIFKLYIYQSRKRGVSNLNGLIKNVTKVNKLEREIASVCEKKTIQFNNKWKSRLKNYCLI